MSGITSATVMAGMAAASAAMTIVSAVGSANAQAQQGAAAAQAGQLRQQQMTQQAQIAQIQAKQLRAKANDEMGAAERQAIEANRRGGLLASKARAVMAASGGGVDNNLVASLIGESDYNANTALYQGKEKARGLNNQALMKDFESSSDQWSGNASAASGAYAQERAGSASAMTIVGGVAQAGLSLASKYGGTAPGGTPQTGGFTALSAGDTMNAWNSAPDSFKFGPGWGPD